MNAQAAQNQAKTLLREVVRSVGWTEKRNGSEYIMSDNAGHPMSKIRTGYKSRNLASMTSPSRDGKPVKLKVNTSWWDEATREEQLGLICHEATHLKVHSGNGAAHRPEFWEVNKMVYRAVAQDERFSSYDWEKVSDFAVNDPNAACVDRRCETVEERTEKMKEVRNYR